MDGPRDDHTKRGKSGRERQNYMISQMWNLKYDTDELISEEKQTHRHREQTCGCQGWGDGRNGSLVLAEAN